MKIWLQQFITIARLTALEAIRQPIGFLLFSTVLLLVALLPLVLSHTLGESARFVRDGGLAFMWVAGLILGAHLASAALADEIRRGTVSAVLSKPVQRWVFLLAKYVGIASVMLLFCFGMTMAVLLSTRAAAQPYEVDWWGAGPLLAALASAFMLAGLINFLLRRPFISTAYMTLMLLLTLAFGAGGLVHHEGGRMPFGDLYDWRVLPVATLIALAILVLSGISVALATRLRTIPTLVGCGALFFLGLLSDYYFGARAEASILASTLYHLLPNWQHFWVVDALTGHGTVPWSYVAMVGGYAMLYLFGVLLLGLVAFRHMDVQA